MKESPEQLSHRITSETDWELDGDSLVGGADDISVANLEEFAGVRGGFGGSDGAYIDEFQVIIQGKENIQRMVEKGVRFEGWEAYQAPTEGHDQRNKQPRPSRER